MALTRNAQASSSRQGDRSTPDGAADEERLVKPVIGDDMEVDEDGLEAWTVNTYVQQTKQKDVTTDSTLSKLLAEIRSMEEQISDQIGKVIDTAILIEEANEGDAMIEELARSVCRSIEIRAVLHLRGSVIKAMQAKMRQSQDIVNPAEAYERQAADKAEEYMKKSARQKFSNDEEYMRFRTDLWQVHHPNQGCPPMSNWLDKGDGDESEDDDVEVGPTLQNYKCLASHMPIKDAVVNPGCGHHFSREFVMGLFSQGRGAARPINCPAMGCNLVIQKEDLQADKTFQSRADQHFKRETQRDDAVEDFEEMSD